MTAIYDPWHVQPRQLPSNLRRVAQGRGEGRTLSVQVSNPAPATNSPPAVIVIPVRVHTQPNAFRIRLSAHSQAYPSTGDNWRGGRSLIGRSLPASFSNAGPSGRNQIFGAVYRLLRAFPSRIHALQKPMRGLAQTLKSLSWLVPFHGFNHDGRNVGNVRKAVGEIRNV